MDQEPHQLDLVPIGAGQHHISLLPKTSTELPFFYLTKQKRLLGKAIRFDGTDTDGRPMRWTVTPNTNAAIGAPAIEAHEVWVRLIMPAINATRSPEGVVPDIVALGGVRECLRTIGWSQGGFTARRMLRALNQIGSAWCVADFWMPTRDRDEKGEARFTHVKGAFSRMAIYAIGSKHLTDEQLRSGAFDFSFDLDDTVYVQLHPLEVTIQQNQPPRIVDNQYLFSVLPTSRRWYELVAPKIYGALKHKKPYCEIRYSWYIRHHHTLTRLSDRRRIVMQMERLVRDHRRRGYISDVEYRSVREPQNQLDVLIRYFPGPEAKASVERIRNAQGRRSRSVIDIPVYTDAETGKLDERYIEEPPVRKPRLEQEKREHPLLGELTRRGVAKVNAEKLLARLPEDQPAIDQLEWGDHLVTAAAPGEIKNPGGYYYSLLRDNIMVPKDFETSRKRKLREEAHAAATAESQGQARLQLAYDAYQEAEIDGYITQNEAEYEQVFTKKQQEFLGRDPNNERFSREMVHRIVTGAARAAIKARIVFTTFSAFCQEQQELEQEVRGAEARIPHSSERAVENSTGALPDDLETGSVGREGATHDLGLPSQASNSNAFTV